MSSDPPSDATERMVDVAGADEIMPGTMKIVRVDATDIVLVNLDGEFYALQGICTHELTSLEDADLEGHVLTCSMHFSGFDVRSGAVLEPPATEPLATYPVHVDGGRVVIRLPSGPIPVNG